MSDNKFSSEIIDLPSGGKLYPKDHPCAEGKLEIKYMTAKEEDILTSQNLIRKGVVVDMLLDSLILTQGVKTEDLILGDKNAVMVAARVLAYGPEYSCEITNPKSGEAFTHIFNLADCPFKTLSEGVSENKFEIELPISKKKITFKLLTGKEENLIEEELKSSAKLGGVKPELTTRLRYTITSADGDESQSTINNFVQNLLARDSMYLRNEIRKVSPDIVLKQEVEIEGETVTVDIPMTVDFFWPGTE
tara:strand:- start:811 stop:1554 length:744 start_codon:yes stop_codon:yes gene_type:complete